MNALTGIMTSGCPNPPRLSTSAEWAEMEITDRRAPSADLPGQLDALRSPTAVCAARLRTAAASSTTKIVGASPVVCEVPRRQSRIARCAPEGAGGRPARHPITFRARRPAVSCETRMALGPSLTTALPDSRAGPLDRSGSPMKCSVHRLLQALVLLTVASPPARAMTVAPPTLAYSMDLNRRADDLFHVTLRSTASRRTTRSTSSPRPRPAPTRS